jgi:hypothetical protein
VVSRPTHGNRDKWPGSVERGLPPTKLALFWWRFLHWVLWPAAVSHCGRHFLCSACSVAKAVAGAMTS